MSGYYPHATGSLGYSNPRSRIGDKATWSQHFKNNGYYTARVSKVFHMGVPGGIEQGSDGADDELSWTERFNSQGPEWKAQGDGETLENNPDGMNGIYACGCINQIPQTIYKNKIPRRPRTRIL